MNRLVFREYDIRGVAETDLNPVFTESLGKAYGSMIKRGGGATVSIGYDARTTSPLLCDAFTQGVISTGVSVICIGLVPTPTLYFSIYHLQTDGGVMITGSHNPPEFNGFKLNKGSSSIHGAAIQELADMIEQEDYATGNGSLTRVDVIPPYREMIASKTTVTRPLKIVLDAGNGCGGLFCPDLMRLLGVEVVELFCEVDGSFPNHHPDPTVPANLTDLIAKVREVGADAGIAYDGDADRIGAVDEKGNILFGDQLLIIFARDILARKPGAGIVFDVKCSQNLVDDIVAKGGKPYLNPTGHSLIKARLEKEGAELAGEMSAHIFFKDDFYGFDDAIFATARLLQIMSQKSAPLSTFLADLPPLCNTPEIKVDCPDDQKFGVVKELTALFKKEYAVVDIDGARVTVGDGWGLVRASNTTPVLVLRFEAPDGEKLDALKELFYQKLISIPVLANTPRF